MILQEKLKKSINDDTIKSSSLFERVRPREFDTEYDVQQERAEVDVQAGISGLRLFLNLSYIEPRLPVTLSIITSTSGHRGVHMSRLVAAAQASAKNAQKLEDYLGAVCREVDATQAGSSIQCEFELPYGDQFAKIRIATSRKQHSLNYSFLVNGTTSCPCSKRISGIGHMQRATLLMEVDSIAPLSPNFFGIIGRMAECFSSSPVAFLKRVDEASAVVSSQENSRFVEDVARECLKRFPDAKKVEVRSFESIHMHDAVASWSRDGSQKRARKNGRTSSKEEQER